jgi:hypothetical protein
MSSEIIRQGKAVIEPVRKNRVLERRRLVGGHHVLRPRAVGIAALDRHDIDVRRRHLLQRKSVGQLEAARPWRVAGPMRCRRSAGIASKVLWARKVPYVLGDQDNQLKIQENDAPSEGG